MIGILSLIIYYQIAATRLHVVHLYTLLVPVIGEHRSSLTLATPVVQSQLQYTLKQSSINKIYIPMNLPVHGE